MSWNEKREIKQKRLGLLLQQLPYNGREGGGEKKDVRKGSHEGKSPELIHRRAPVLVMVENEKKQKEKGRSRAECGCSKSGKGREGEGERIVSKKKKGKKKRKSLKALTIFTCSYVLAARRRRKGDLGERSILIPTML